MGKWMVAVCLAGLMAGCSSVPPKPEWVKPGKAIANQWEAPAAGTGTMTITRDATFQGMGCTFRAFLDGTPIGDLRIAQRITVYPNSGEHIASIQPVGFCLGSDLAESSLVINQGEEKRFRLSVTYGGPVIQPTAF
jgi:hypothetical protein